MGRRAGGVCWRGALYTAKIRRGGMGTGMPYWGSIFTEQELAAVVDYLWSFSFGVPQ
jgi:mono/diheme cytochrome c family protein